MTLRNLTAPSFKEARYFPGEISRTETLNRNLMGGRSSATMISRVWDQFTFQMENWGPKAEAFELLGITQKGKKSRIIMG